MLGHLKKLKLLLEEEAGHVFAVHEEPQNEACGNPGKGSTSNNDDKMQSGSKQNTS